MDKIIVIAGPTASGKTAAAIKIAKKYNGEIVCADSRTVYKELDIGSAKPTDADCKQVKHHLLNLISLNQDFSVYDFKEKATFVIEDIQNRKKIPIITGGSGLYIDSIIFDYKFRNPRKYPDENIDGKSLGQLIEIAESKYPQELKKIDIKNRRRVEQLIIKGPTKDNDRINLKRNTLIICICPKMPILRQNIATRLKQMLNKSFIQEVKNLRKKFGRKNPLLQTTGYKRINEYLDKKINLVEMKKLIVSDTVNLARKQKTWFRRNPNTYWVENITEAQKNIEQFLQS